MYTLEWDCEQYIKKECEEVQTKYFETVLYIGLYSI